MEGLVQPTPDEGSTVQIICETEVQHERKLLTSTNESSDWQLLFGSQTFAQIQKHMGERLYLQLAFGVIWEGCGSSRHILHPSVKKILALFLCCLKTI